MGECERSGIRRNFGRTGWLTDSTPAQSQTLILDTGSAEVMVYGSGCSDCGSSTFNTAGSSSYQATGRTASVLYSGGFVMNGPIATENINVGGFAQNGQQYGE